MRCVSPWYNHPGWLGVKHQFTYLLTCPCQSKQAFVSTFLRLDPRKGAIRRTKRKIPSIVRWASVVRDIWHFLWTDKLKGVGVYIDTLSGRKVDLPCRGAIRLSERKIQTTERERDTGTAMDIQARDGTPIAKGCGSLLVWRSGPKMNSHGKVQLYVQSEKYHQIYDLHVQRQRW